MRETAEAVNQDALRSLWVKTAAVYFKEADEMEAQNVPEPTADNEPISRMLALLILIPQIPGSIDEYRRRGFSEEEMEDLLREYQVVLGGGLRAYGYPGARVGYYEWLVHFAKACIFRLPGFQFEVQKLPSSALFLRHKQTGELCPILLRGTLVGDGRYILGTDGFEEAEDTFTVSFREDAENFYGHGVYDCVVSREQETFSKAQWDCAIRPGEYCLGLHICYGADITPENITNTLGKAKEIAAERYRDIQVTELFCDSWLLDPSLETVAGPNSKLAAFMKSFCKYPQKSSGTSAISYVFSKRTTDYDSLPETTSLQRNMKKWYQEGKYIYFTCGLYCK